MTRYVVVLLFASAVVAVANPPGCRLVTEACETNSDARKLIRLNKVQQVYKNLIFPTALAIQKDPSLVEPLFERSVVRGRVTPVGQFEDFLGVEEYFYGLAATPNSRVENVTFRSLLADGAKVAVQVDIFFCRLPTGGCPQNQPVSPVSNTLTQTGFFTFNMNDKIISFDLTILNLGAATDPTSDLERQTNIFQTCTLLTRGIPQLNLGPTCTSTFNDPANFPAGFNFQQAGPDTAFVNCVSFMKSIPYGSWNRANSNTFVCRQLHSLLTPFRPDVHCPHTSPGGGMMCVDFPYSSFYDSIF